MKNIIIEPIIREKCPDLVLGCIEATVDYQTDYPDLLAKIASKINALRGELALETMNQLPRIHATREAYKALGKKPSRYRPSAEALLRRVLMGKGLYQVNNLVDLLNLVSISTGFSIGGYDADTIQGTIHLGRGKADEPYQAIGRGALNIEALPLFRDEQGAFGSPTSDSERTMVRATTTRFLMIILAFDGETETLKQAMTLAQDLLETHANAQNIESLLL